MLRFDDMNIQRISNGLDSATEMLLDLPLEQRNADWAPASKALTEAVPHAEVDPSWPHRHGDRTHYHLCAIGSREAMLAFQDAILARLRGNRSAPGRCSAAPMTRVGPTISAPMATALPSPM